MNFVNVSVYKFIDLDSSTLVSLRQKFLDESKRLNLKGTILLAPEGINCFVAGPAEAIVVFKNCLIESLGTAELPFKDSLSDHQPFTRMLVKIKKEIITMGNLDVKPAQFTGKRITPNELKAWLDEGRELVILDTRNDYEVKLGTFDNAINMDLKTFRQFPHKINELSSALKDKTVVTFCTGGIRCEKASAYMVQHGFKDVYQLDGGILKYFEQTGGAHYRGECFVFDHRVALDASLRETGAALCYNCQMPVTVEEQKSPLYKPETQCPNCAHGKPIAHKEKIAVELKQAAQE